MDSRSKQLLAYSFAMLLLALPSSVFAQAQTGAETGQAAQEGASGDDAIYCRPPQQRTDSIMRGPKVCLTVKRWKELHDRGQDISADGQTIVSGAQKQMEADPGLSGRQ
jgi:hypothetical protein